MGRLFRWFLLCFALMLVCWILDVCCFALALRVLLVWLGVLWVRCVARLFLICLFYCLNLLVCCSVCLVAVLVLCLFCWIGCYVWFAMLTHAAYLIIIIDCYCDIFRAVAVLLVLGWCGFYYCNWLILCLLIYWCFGWVIVCFRYLFGANYLLTFRFVCYFEWLGLFIAWLTCVMLIVLVDFLWFIEVFYVCCL